MSFQLFAPGIAVAQKKTEPAQPPVTGITAKERIFGRKRLAPRTRRAFEESVVSGEEVARRATDPLFPPARKHRTAGVEVIATTEPVQPSSKEKKAAKAKAKNMRRREAKKLAKQQAKQ